MGGQGAIDPSACLLTGHSVRLLCGVGMETSAGGVVVAVLALTTAR